LYYVLIGSSATPEAMTTTTNQATEEVRAVNDHEFDQDAEETRGGSIDWREQSRQKYQALEDSGEYVTVMVEAQADTWVDERWIVKVPRQWWQEDPESERVRDWIEEHYGDHGEYLDQEIGDESNRKLTSIVGEHDEPVDQAPTFRTGVLQSPPLALAIWSKVPGGNLPELDHETRDRLEKAITHSTVPEALAEVVAAVIGEVALEEPANG
jgi:hypothetical protein